MKLTQIKALAIANQHHDDDYIGIRLQDHVYNAQIDTILDHESRNFGGDFECDLPNGEWLGGICAIETRTAKYRSDYGSYGGSVALILGSNSAHSGYDPEEIIMHSPTVIDIITI